MQYLLHENYFTQNQQNTIKIYIFSPCYTCVGKLNSKRNARAYITHYKQFFCYIICIRYEFKHRGICCHVCLCAFACYTINIMPIQIELTLPNAPSSVSSFLTFFCRLQPRRTQAVTRMVSKNLVSRQHLGESVV